MKTMPQHPEADVLRKTLDAYDRRRSRKLALFVTFILLLGLLNALGMISLWDSTDPRSLHIEIMAGFGAVMFFVFGMGVAVVRVSRDNARRILRAIEEISGQKAGEAE